MAVFDAEEPLYFSPGERAASISSDHRPTGGGFHAMLISDLTGHDVGFRSLGGDTPEAIRRLVCLLGAENHPILPKVLAATPPPANLGAIALLNSYVPDMSDHHIFRLHHHPCLFFSCGHWPHYHQPTDTPDRLNYAKLVATSTWTRELLEKLDSIELPAYRSTSDITIASEAARIARALPPAVLVQLGMSAPSTRADVDAFVGRLFRETFELG